MKTGKLAKSSPNLNSCSNEQDFDFLQECYYCKELMGVVVFTKAADLQSLKVQGPDFTCPWTFAKTTTPIKVHIF